MDVSIRHLSTLDDYNAAVELQYETWGRGFAGCVPAAILMVSQRVGGISAGAFDPDGRMAGCVFGITGVRDGVAVHWSDILAVTPEYRGTGLGKRLKWFQRAELLKAGVRTMFWTFDPLQALNANLNINTLRARPVEYVVNMYGDTGSDLHAGLGTDRFVVQWDLDAPEVAAAVEGRNIASAWTPDAPIVNGGPFPEVETVLVEIPVSINETKRVSPQEAMRWREQTRAAIVHYLSRGHRVTGFHPLDGGRRAYAMSRGERT